MTSKEALENIRNGKFITCKVCSNNYNQWLTGCMCCRNELSKSKGLDIIEKDLDRLEKLEKVIEILKKALLLNVKEVRGIYYVLGYDTNYCMTKEEYELLKGVLENDSN